MKKLKMILLIVMVLLLVACACHTTIAYMNLSMPGQSAPTWVALLVSVPYLLAIAICGVVVLLLVRRSNRNNMH